MLVSVPTFTSDASPRTDHPRHWHDATCRFEAKLHWEPDRVIAVIIGCSLAARPAGRPPLWAMARRVPRVWSSRSLTSGPAVRSSIETIQFEDVVRRAHQRPFALDLLESAQQELPKAPCLFDLPNDRFDDRWSSARDRADRGRAARHVSASASRYTRRWRCQRSPSGSRRSNSPHRQAPAGACHPPAVRWP